MSSSSQPSIPPSAPANDTAPSDAPARAAPRPVATAMGAAGAPRAAALIVAALLVIALFRLLGFVHRGNYVLDLGSLGFPAPLYAAFLMVWCIFGSIAVGLFCWGIARLAMRDGAAAEFGDSWRRGSDGRWIAIASGAATVLSLLFHFLVLRGAPMTDDEGAYRFMAELIASGRLTVPSHPLPQFFDNAFMINDGRLYAKYFLGWPALLALGTALGTPALINPLLFGLTVPPLYLVLKRYTDCAWARAGAVLMITAPMLVLGAATMMSHTSCMCALAWAWYALLRCRDEDAGALTHLAFALCLALGFFVRPISAVGLGVPLGISWLWGLRSLTTRRRLGALIAFTAVAFTTLGLFLAANHAQTGDVFTLPYERETSFIAASGDRFRTLSRSHAHLQFSSVSRALATSAIAFLRLNFALFGWPIGLAVTLLAVGFARARLAWGVAIGFGLIHLPVTDAGIDSFGPVHYYEVALPVIVLCTLGLSRVSVVLESYRVPAARVIAPSLLVALIASAWLGYVPVRAAAIVRMSQDILAPSRAVEKAGLHDAVVFGPRPWGGMCHASPTHNFVFFRPNNDPDLQDDILWVNNFGKEENLELMKHFPGRTGYVLVRMADCSLVPMPLADIDPKLAKPRF